MLKGQFITFSEDGIMGSRPVQILGGTGDYEGIVGHGVDVGSAVGPIGVGTILRISAGRSTRPDPHRTEIGNELLLILSAGTQRTSRCAAGPVDPRGIIGRGVDGPPMRGGPVVFSPDGDLPAAMVSRFCGTGRAAAGWSR